MSDDNLPEESGTVDDAPTFDQQVEELSNLLPDPDEDLHDKTEDEAAAEGDDDPEAEDVGEEADENDDEPTEEIKGGRFAPDTAKVTLEDGSVITVAELKRNNLFQRDYTKKTTEHAEAVKAFEARRAEVDQYAQSLNQSRDYLAWYANTFLPKAPEPFQGSPETDPLGYMQWQQQRDQYLTHQQAFEKFAADKKAEDERKAGETRQQMTERLAREKDALLSAVPTLKDPVKGKALVESWQRGAEEHYGVTPQEFQAIADHRFMVVLRDALAYRRLKAKAPEVQKEVAAKPTIKGGKRGAPREASAKQKQVRSEQLRQTGSFDAGVKALMDLDL